MAKKNIGIISYCDKIRTYASVNHQYYADIHGYTYIYDISPTKNSVFKNKIEKILKLLPLFDYIFWIDDDAFFTKYDVSLESLIEDSKKYDLVFCKSPMNEGKWTYLSSGNFFIKNTKKSIQFLKDIINTPLEESRENWRQDVFGMFTNGDQDIITYLLFNDPSYSKPSFHTILPYETFNTRPFHFKESPSEHFLVHFTGTDKFSQSLMFAQKYNLSPAITPLNTYDDYKGIFSPS